MKICYVINIGHEAGGAERSVRLLTEAMRERGHTVNVIATDHRAHEAAAFADTVVPAVDGNAIERFGGFFWSPAVYRSTRQAMSRMRPDVVHLHTIGLFSPSVLDATRGHKRVMTVHGPEDWTLEMLSWNLASRWVGSGRLAAADRARYAYLRFVQRPAYLPRLRRLNRVIVPSVFYADRIRRDVNPVPVHVVPNGIVLTPPAPLLRPHVFLFVGRFEQIKGVLVLAEAFATVAERFPSARLVLVGDGPLRRQITDVFARRTLCDRVELTGRLSHDVLPAIYADAGVVVIPSIVPDNFPTVAIEALAAGRPIIGSATGGIPELAGHGRNALLVDPGDVTMLAEAMGRMLADESLVRRMGAASAQRAPDYSIDTMTDRIEQTYRTLLDPVPAT